MRMDQQSGGLFAASKRLAALLLASGKTRLELLGNEIEEERVYILRMLLLAQGIFLCIIAFVVVSIEFISIVFIEYRTIVLGMSALLFLVLAVSLTQVFKSMARRKKNTFAASIAELEEDLRQIKAAMSHDQQDQ